jgi:hypothetical protein
MQFCQHRFTMSVLLSFNYQPKIWKTLFRIKLNHTVTLTYSPPRSYMLAFLYQQYALYCTIKYSLNQHNMQHQSNWQIWLKFSVFNFWCNLYLFHSQHTFRIGSNKMVSCWQPGNFLKTQFIRCFSFSRRQAGWKSVKLCSIHIVITS